MAAQHLTSHTPQRNAVHTSTKRRGRNGRQRVDALTTLILADPLIARDAETYENLRRAARSNIARTASNGRPSERRTLYRLYRGSLFPLRTAAGRRVLAWRHLSDWLKAQIAALCIQQGPCKVFTVKLHDGLLAELQADDVDLKVYLRDRLSRCLRSALGAVPWFMFVIENTGKDGTTRTRPHIHGMISILPATLRELRKGGYSMRDQILIRREGMEAAMIRAGEQLTWKAIQAASGNADPARPTSYNGRKQSRNVWWRIPYYRMWNPAWVSYLFKNTYVQARSICEDRFVMSQRLTTEARRLWDLIRDGEQALSAWN